MGRRPLTGYHVYAFTIPLLVLHLPYAMGVDWSVADELRTLATYFVLAVVWHYLWFVLNPAYTVRRFRRGNVWWFEIPWIWRFPLDYYVSVLVSVAIAGIAALADGDGEPLRRHLWMLAGLAVLVAVAVLRAPLYHRWYRHMRRPGADDRAVTGTYPPPAPEAVWSGGVPDLDPLEPASAPREAEAVTDQWTTRIAALRCGRAGVCADADLHLARVSARWHGLEHLHASARARVES